MLVEENGGRMSLKDMPSHIGVGIEVVERAAETLAAKGHGQLINFSLITPLYLDFLMEEVYDDVSDQGRVPLSDLTNKYWLPLDYVKEVLAARMEDQLPAGCQIISNCIVTKTFSEREKCKVRGILRAVTKPVALS